MPPFNIQELKQKIAQGQAKKVLNFLIENQDQIKRNSTKNKIHLLSARWTEYQNKIQIESDQAQSLRKRQIEHDLLLVLDTLQEKEPTPQKSRLIYLVGGLLACLVIFGGIKITKFLDPQGNKKEEQVADIDKVDSLKIDTSKTPLSSTQEEDKTGEKKTAKVANPAIPKGQEAVEKPADRSMLGESATTTKETTSPTSQALTVNCKTNKGNENLLFEEGETLELYFKVNKACTLRIIYQLADGRIILLENDRIVNTQDTEKWMSLGAFEVSPPLGAEQLFVFAQDAKFPPLTTVQTEDGYTQITDGLPDALRKSRGLKKKRQFAEAKLKITTKK